MVYTSIPAYIDPANWQQQQPNHQQGNTGVPGSQLLHPPPPLPPWTQSHGASSSSSIRPGSMADRARMANIPMQEPAQRCPRCDSTNTKFCYFNNYSLSQPRHFCKTCRRYWTRGGALRNVPVGGGCRRNKRSKGTSSSSSKSPASTDRQTTSASGPTNSASSSGGGSAADMVGLGPMVPPSLRFMAPLHHQLGDHFSGGSCGDIGLNYGMSYSANSAPMVGMGDLNFHIGSGSNAGSVLSSAALEQWRVPQTQQFPFLAGLEASSSHGLFPFESSTNEAPGYGIGGGGGSCGIPAKPSASGMISLMASSVKMEENNTLSRQFLGMSNSSSDQQYWSTGTTTSAWTDLTGFSSSSTTTNPQ